MCTFPNWLSFPMGQVMLASSHSERVSIQEDCPNRGHGTLMKRISMRRSARIPGTKRGNGKLTTGQSIQVSNNIQQINTHPCMWRSFVCSEDEWNRWPGTMVSLGKYHRSVLYQDHTLKGPDCQPEFYRTNQQMKFSSDWTEKGHDCRYYSSLRTTYFPVMDQIFPNLS